MNTLRQFVDLLFLLIKGARVGIASREYWRLESNRAQGWGQQGARLRVLTKE